ncbi:unannotated protein [freshwater metagenome]|uniref:Unannotated protein n=1 Tax=freshwater metagenome TaxID=449393 RepID=A0A6J7JDA3_9ZZZZ
MVRRPMDGYACTDGGAASVDPRLPDPTIQDVDMSENTDKLKGRVKETAGAATGDDELKAEGKTDQNAGKLKEKVNDTVDSVKDKLTGK